MGVRPLSERAAQRVFDSACGVIERRLKLKVNREKSSIRRAAQATLLGFGFFADGPRAGIRIPPKAIARLKDQLRRLARRSWSVSMAYRIGGLNRLIIGWMAYFRLAQRVSVLGKLDGWPRRRLRQVRWKKWKTTFASPSIAALCYRERAGRPATPPFFPPQLHKPGLGGSTGDGYQ